MIFLAQSTCIDWYYLAFPRDKWHTKSIVIFIYILDTAQALIMINDCWNIYVKGFGDYAGLDKVRNEWLAAPIFSAIGQVFPIDNPVLVSFRRLDFIQWVAWYKSPMHSACICSREDVVQSGLLWGSVNGWTVLYTMTENIIFHSFLFYSS